jgi:hypothetical protein
MTQNLLYYGDNLDVLRRHVQDETVDLVYLDPPFNSKATFKKAPKAKREDAHKIERVFRNSFQAREGEFYDHLVSRLFENVLHRHTHSRIYFSQRGSRTRQAQLEQAIRRGASAFEAHWQTKVSTEIRVDPQTAVGEPCLQVIDYMNWAVYRAFVKREMRYYRFVEDKVSLLVDVYDVAAYPKNWYHHDNPFDIEKASPL